MSADGSKGDGGQGGDATVRAGEWADERKPARRRFPHGEARGLALRVACAREAYADLAQHVKESLRAEVCGVLVGEVCEDDDGRWVEVRASIRGTAASQGSAHVTFTQETWTRIHQERESRYPKLRIVGWYHSHPGFGVEFSEMDTFIHRNFFSADSQVALVSDSVSGEDAACVNSAGGIVYLERLWVDGRERALKTPAAKAPAASAAGGGAAAGRIDALEARVAQLVAGIDEMQERVSRFYLFIGMAIVMIATVWVAAQLWMGYSGRYEPPKLRNTFSVPIHLGDKDVMVGLQVVDWDVPPELNSIMLQVARERLAAEEARIKAEQEAADKKAAAGGADHAAPGPPPPPSGSPKP